LNGAPRRGSPGIGRLRPKDQVIGRIVNHVFLNQRQVVAHSQRQALPAKHVDIKRNSTGVHGNRCQRSHTENLPVASGDSQAVQDITAYFRFIKRQQPAAGVDSAIIPVFTRILQLRKNIMPPRHNYLQQSLPPRFHFRKKMQILHCLQVKFLRIITDQDNAAPFLMLRT